MADLFPPPMPVTFTVVRAGGTIVEVQTSSPELNHFLHLLKLTRSANTWLAYALDLRLFFQTVGVAPQDVTRQHCLTFIEQQDRQGLATATINRRLAALSSLFQELHRLDPERFGANPISPIERGTRHGRQRGSLYRKSPQRLPDVLGAEQLQRLFAAVRTWRDRTLILLMWVSCLRISEALAIRFDDIECSNRSIRIRAGKGGQPRVVYMDAFTLEALNRYLDLERGELAPEEPQTLLHVAPSSVEVLMWSRFGGRPLSPSPLSTC